MSHPTTCTCPIWFRGIDAGDYTVSIQMEGYEPITRTVTLAKSLNLGDFPLKKS